MNEIGIFGCLACKLGSVRNCYGGDLYCKMKSFAGETCLVGGMSARLRVF